MYEIQLHDGLSYESSDSEELYRVDVQPIDDRWITSRVSENYIRRTRHGFPTWIKAPVIYFVGLFVTTIFMWLCCRRTQHTRAKRSNFAYDRKTCRCADTGGDRFVDTDEEGAVRERSASICSRKGSIDQETTRADSGISTSSKYQTTEATKSTSGLGEWI